MNISQNIFIGIGIVILLYAILRLFHRKDDSIDKEIDDIINSDKYKVKGQYD